MRSCEAEMRAIEARHREQKRKADLVRSLSVGEQAVFDEKEDEDKDGGRDVMESMGKGREKQKDEEIERLKSRVAELEKIVAEEKGGKGEEEA